MHAHMTAHHLGCGCSACGGTESCAFPPEFVRVRHYFGQRLGVMELSDQTAYHAGKMAFHNARAHGAGVLCGLTAERFPLTPGARTTVLRVIRGAALDACGREVVVGVDQCVDVAAWFMKNRAKPELSGWTPGSTQAVVVAIRYDECPSDPSPAPRDPCGCDPGGCEYGRVREGFELRLFTPEQAEEHCYEGEFPDPGALLTASSPEAIHELVGAPCPEAPERDHEWLCLAEVPVILDASGVPSDLGAADNAIEHRRSLLSTRALQLLLLGVGGSANVSGTLGDGPRLGAVTFVHAPSPAPLGEGTLSIAIDLATSATPPALSPIVDATVAATKVHLEELKSTGWSSLTGTLTFDPTGPKIDLKVSGLAAGPRYRLSIEQPFGTPIADEEGRALTPTNWARRLAFVADGALLRLDPSV